MTSVRSRGVKDGDGAPSSSSNYQPKSPLFGKMTNERSRGVNNDDDVNDDQSSSSNCRNFRPKRRIFSLVPFCIFLYVNSARVFLPKGQSTHRHPLSSSKQQPRPAPSPPPLSTISLNRTVVDENIALDKDLPNLWISVHDWHEGISKWHVSLSQMMALAKSLDAVLVEPAIQNGRLIRCGSSRAVGLHTVYNRTMMLDYYPRLASCQEFQNAKKKSTPKVFTVCMDRDKGKCNEMPYCWRLRECPTLSEVIEYSRKHPNMMVVLSIYDVWHQSLNPNISHNNSPLLPPPQKLSALRHDHFQFTASLYDLLGSALALANVTDKSFGVVHWRAERKGMNYTECARDIVVTSQAMDFPKGSPSFLISSFSLDPSHSWGGSKKLAGSDPSSETALSFLLGKGGFLRLDQLLPGLEDAIYYVVLDVLLAEKATSFATCLRACSRLSQWCQRCNHQGDFAEYVMRHRRVYRHGNNATIPDTSTLPCWPQSSSKLQEISKVWNDR